MEKPNEEAYKNVTSNTDTNNKLNISKEKFLINQIMNYLHYDFHCIDLFSTNELERIIVFCEYSKHKTLHILENYSKEEIVKMIEDFNLKIVNTKKRNEIERLNNSSGLTNSCNLLITLPRKRILFMKKYGNSNSLSYPDNNYTGTPLHNLENTSWSFINSQLNIIDLKDLLKSFDHHKLVKKASITVKDKDLRKLNDYFDKYTEIREKKYQELFKANLEENDLLFLSDDKYMEAEYLKKQRRICMNNITEKLSNDLGNFSTYFTNSSELIKFQILEFLDVLSIGKIGIVNKNFYNLIYGKFKLQKLAKDYCLAIFKYSNIYLNDEEKIKQQYKSFLMMFQKRPRIRYGGIYYSRVRFNRVGDNNGFNNNSITTVTYYRIIRFLPSGKVHSLTTPFSKSSKILNAMSKCNLDLDIKSGRFYIDTSDIVIVELFNNDKSEKSGIYKYKIVEIQEFPDLKFPGLELIEYSYKTGNDIMGIKLVENFPKKFKFRSLDILKNDLYLKSCYI